MKKIMIFAALAVLALLAGCTSVDSTQRFNGIPVGPAGEKARCHTTVEIPGLFFFGLPIFSGGLKDGSMTMFTSNLTTERITYVLTQEMKSKGANRIIDLQVNRTGIPMLLFSWRTIQASATGMTSKSAAVKRAAENYDLQP